jgi:hypothetical protein
MADCCERGDEPSGSDATELVFQKEKYKREVKEERKSRR